MPGELADKIRLIDGVNGVEKYLLKQTEPHPVIGLEPGAPLRVLEGGKLLPVEKGLGRWFHPGDRYVVITGNVFREDYTGSSGGIFMRLMRHRFKIGSSLRFPGFKQEVRVVGNFAVEPLSAGAKIVLPLLTAQEFLNLKGQVTHFFVSLRSSKFTQKVSETIRSSLGKEVRVRIH